MKANFYVVLDYEHFLKDKKSETNNYVKNSGSMIIACANSLEASTNAIRDIAKNYEEDNTPLINTFCGCDAHKYVDIIDGQEHYENGLEYIDSMGQQVMFFHIVSEQEMMDTIINLVEKQEDKVLALPDNMEFCEWEYLDPDSKNYKPLKVVHRDYKDEEDGTEYVVYDVETLAKYKESGETLEYVESLECIGIDILYQIYRNVYWRNI